jgi:hypothetical protein
MFNIVICTQYIEHCTVYIEYTEASSKVPLKPVSRFFDIEGVMQLALCSTQKKFIDDTVVHLSVVPTQLTRMNIMQLLQMIKIYYR